MSDEDLHNVFFYANICHVCKGTATELSLKRCSNCKMISYCGKEHQKQHWLQHKNICRIMSEMLDETDKSNLLEGFKDVTMKEWVEAKMNLMLVVGLKLKRQLLLYEEQMFKFPKACAVCHETNSKLITDCQYCPCASFCYKHKDDPSHVKICESLYQCLELDIASTVFIQNHSRHAVPFHTEMAYLPTSMRYFIDLYINEDKSIVVSADVQKIHMSEFLTRPLTLLYAIERLDYSTGSILTVHVIGANLIEVGGIEIWETLLHWLPSLTTLNIVLIGPELDSSIEKSECNICDYCIEKQMNLYLDMHGILYKEYVTSDSFVEPNIVVGYNLGLHEWNLDSPKETWSESIRVLEEKKYPFVLTSYTTEEAKQEHKRLCDILEKKVTYLYCDKNPFSSLRPHRDYETEGVYYQNQHLMIFRNLD